MVLTSRSSRSSSTPRTCSRPPPSRRRDSQEKHGEPHGKTEAWHILWAAEGATILAGIKDGLSREELFEAFKPKTTTP